MKLTQEQIEEIRKRAEAATPGPWTYGGDKWGDLVVYAPSLRGFHNNGGEIADVSGDLLPDAEFIANARQDVPNLLAHIERLDKYIVHLGEQVESDKEVKFGYYNENKMFKQIIEELEAQNKRMREVLEHIDEVSDDFYDIKPVNGTLTFVLKEELENYRDTIQEIAIVPVEALKELSEDAES
jgi:hypothetical protein